MHAVFAGLTTLDVIHALDHEPDPRIKTTSVDHAMSAGGPATNAAMTVAALERARVAGATGPGRTTGRAVTQTRAAVPRSATLLTALGSGPVAAFLDADIAAGGVSLLDATATGAAGDSHVPGTPAISSIVEHPEGRMVASTNARLAVDPERGRTLLAEAVAAYGEPDVVLVDGHNPSLAEAALLLGVETHGPGEAADSAGADPFARFEAKPGHVRVLDGGSWKGWFTPLLSFIDVAVVSADFRPPLINAPVGEDVADFLRGFGISRTVRTRGPEPVQWWWDGASGEVPVPGVDEASSASTLGAGDIFHGAFVWALAAIHEAGLPAPSDPTAVISFASSVASLSTRSFGTRRWMGDPALTVLVAEFLEAHPR